MVNETKNEAKIEWPIEAKIEWPEDENAGFEMGDQWGEDE